MRRARHALTRIDTKLATGPAEGPWAQIAARVSGAPAAPVDPGDAARLAAAFGPAFLSWLDPAAAQGREGRLYQRFRRIAALRLSVALTAAGHRHVALKGMAAAHRLYDDPDIRPMADIDLLVRPAEVPDIVAWLRNRGYELAPARSRSAWGLVSDASFRPLLAPDGSVNIDLHVQPDAWPLPLGLDAEAVFAASGSCGTPEGDLTVPSLTHLLVLSASHAARDLFALDTAKNLVDGLHILVRHPAAIDWAMIGDIARRAGLRRAFATYFGLLERLTGESGPIGSEWRGAGDAAVSRLAGSFASLDAGTATLSLPGVEKFRREWLFCGPRTALGRWRRRLRGLIAARDGLPQ
jgi:hypothetical protein